MSDDSQHDGRREHGPTNSVSGSEQRSARVLHEEIRAAVASARRSNKVKLGLIDLIVHSCERDEVCARLGLDRETLDALASRREVQRFKVDRTWLFPDWQFTHDSRIPHLTSVVTAAGELGTQTLAGFMSIRRADLTVYGEALSPREWLRQRRDPDAVLTPLRNLAARVH